jgi:hypothetical protein
MAVSPNLNAVLLQFLHSIRGYTLPFYDQYDHLYLVTKHSVYDIKSCAYYNQ